MSNSLLDTPEDQLAALSLPLRALWHAAHDNWDTAHRLVGDDPSVECAWVHAYLHRVEGDNANARYWYRQAGKQPAMHVSLNEELLNLLDALTSDRQLPFDEGDATPKVS